MKKYRYIKAAESDKSPVEELIAELKDDFDYAISGLEQLDRDNRQD